MSTPQSVRPVINLDEVQIGDRPQAFQPAGRAVERFESRMGVIGARIGARMLGYNITAVPPGKRAFPLHNHHANEEMFFILQGSGELRVGDERYTLRAGDFIASPPGGPESAHQIINTGKEELRYLAVSTLIAPEAVEYPDSGKIGILSRQIAPDGSTRMVRHVARTDASVDYWEGE
ncbi:MAG: cupin domain-containing protein [Pseudomonadota bacterium]